METQETRLDHGRLTRTGIPEVVYAETKTLEQIEDIMRSLWGTNGFALATRVVPEMLAVLASRLPNAHASERARALRCGRLPATGRALGVVCAGTSDLPAGDEAAFVLDAFGHDVVRLTDVGVAGIHRMLDGVDTLRSCDAVIVVAGMEGALPGVVAGLLPVPVIGLPTSVGYGVAEGGRAALHTMLASCAPGIGVVNIDNGFGAAALAHKIAAGRRPPN